MGYRKPAFPNGAENTAKNAKKSFKRTKLFRWNGTYEGKSSLSKSNGRNAKGEFIIKKSDVIFCKGNRLKAYCFIDKYHKEFGIRWLLRRIGIYPNAYYNYRKHRKENYNTQKEVTDAIANRIKDATGVDLNEELVDLVKYQTAYSAAAQVFNTCNACLDTLMTLGG